MIVFLTHMQAMLASRISSKQDIIALDLFYSLEDLIVLSQRILKASGRKKKITEENTGKNENCTLGNVGSNLNQNKIALYPKLLSASQLSSLQQNCYLLTDGSFKCPRYHCKLISAS